jgi:hypothetical protein
MKTVSHHCWYLPLLSIVFLSVASMAVQGQQRDYLTDDEIELVRDAQQIDLRIRILTRAIDRRFAVLGIAPGTDTPKDKSNSWGPAPTGTRIELLDDIKRIIQKAVDDIDNLAERPDSIVVEAPTKKEKPKKYEDVFPPAVHILAAAAKRYEPLLKKELEVTKDERERGILIQSGELCEEIIASESRLPSATAKKPGTR